jgi:circadian clock protein KaiC
VRRGENGVIAVFEEQPDRYLARAQRLGFDLSSMIEGNKLRTLYLRPLDLSVDETLYRIQALAEEVGAQRVVIDSLSGFELSVAPAFQEDFRESFSRMISTLSTSGITVMMTVEMAESFTDLRFSPHGISFLIDDIILQRYVEIEGILKRMIAVVKIRGSDHDKALRQYDITSTGIVVGDVFTAYRGLLTGSPGRLEQETWTLYPGLSEIEVRVQEALNARRQASMAELLAHTGLERRALSRALDRLLALNYAIRARDGRRTVYRPAMWALRR